MEEKKVVTYDGLKQYDTLLKEHISDESEKLNEAIAEKTAVKICIWEEND